MNNTEDKQKELMMIRYERKRRIKIVLIILPTFLGLLLSLYRSLLDRYAFSGTDYYYITIMIGLLFATSVSALLMFYLQTGFKKITYSIEEVTSYNKEVERLKSITNELIIHDRQMDNISAEVDTLKNQVYGLSKDNDFTTEQKEALYKTIESRIISNASDRFIEEIRLQVSKELKDTRFFSTIYEGFAKTLERISREIGALNRRSNLNLSLGITVTVIGLILLYTYLFHNNLSTNDSTVNLLAFYIPRLSLVIFIEIFAYFFLRLYKTTLEEIKYYQNEMTNMESKFISLITALELNDQEVIAYVTKSLSETDRNVLKESKLTKNQINQAIVMKDSILDILSKSVDIVKKTV